MTVTSVAVDAFGVNDCDRVGGVRQHFQAPRQRWGNGATGGLSGVIMSL